MRLAGRGFVPPPRRELPVADAARVFRRWSAEDRAERARDLVALPDPTQDPALAWATFELLATVPGEEARAGELIARLEKRGADLGRVALARFRLARGDWGTRLAPLRAHAASGALAEGLRRAAAAVLSESRGAFGLDWIVPVADGTGLANVTLALMRRPALAREHDRAFDWLTQAGPAPFLAEAEAADKTGDWALGTELVTRALAVHGWPGDLEAVLAARQRLLMDDVARPWRFPLPAPEAPAAPHGDWARRLRDASARDATLLEALGDRPRAAAAWLAEDAPDAVVHALRFRDVIGDAALLARLGKPVPDDELAIAKDPALRARALAFHALLPAGLERELIALRLAGAGLAQPPVMAPPEVAAGDDPHHPEARLGVASDLLAAGRQEPAANILAALMRKAEDAPPRLWTVVAQALEAEEPPEELVAAATRVLDRLVPALRENPTAAYAVHEPLLALAQDASRGDGERLLALESWLGIWRATATPPDASSLETLRLGEPELLAVAAARLAGDPSPTARMDKFLVDYPPRTTPPEAWSEALLALTAAI
ncbi:MAG: hypothetical protein U1F43_24665 [Myxococcota bacterium]